MASASKAPRPRGRSSPWPPAAGALPRAKRPASAEGREAPKGCEGSLKAGTTAADPRPRGKSLAALLRGSASQHLAGELGAATAASAVAVDTGKARPRCQSGSSRKTMRRPAAVALADDAPAGVEKDSTAWIDDEASVPRPSTSGEDDDDAQGGELAEVGGSSGSKARARRELPAEEPELVIQPASAFPSSTRADGRPARKRFPVLEHWRNERLFWERTKGSEIATIAAVQLKAIEEEARRRGRTESPPATKTMAVIGPGSAVTGDLRGVLPSPLKPAAPKRRVASPVRSGLLERRTAASAAAKKPGSWLSRASSGSQQPAPHLRSKKAASFVAAEAVSADEPSASCSRGGSPLKARPLASPMTSPLSPPPAAQTPPPTPPPTPAKDATMESTSAGGSPHPSPTKPISSDVRPGKSILRKRPRPQRQQQWSPSPTKAKARRTSRGARRAVCFADEPPETRSIQNFGKEDLWYTGHVVECDRCEALVRWGEEGGFEPRPRHVESTETSRFAQTRVLCGACLVDQAYGNLGAWFVVSLAADFSESAASEGGAGGGPYKLGQTGGSMKQIMENILRLTGMAKTDSLAAVLGNKASSAPDVRKIVLQKARIRLLQLMGLLNARPLKMDDRESDAQEEDEAASASSSSGGGGGCSGGSSGSSAAAPTRETKRPAEGVSEPKGAKRRRDDDSSGAAPEEGAADDAAPRDGCLTFSAAAAAFAPSQSLLKRRPAPPVAAPPAIVGGVEEQASTDLGEVS
eukprot:TRINITY_DN26549_c0_g1_i2.p1 TRINITY_DN26549_c0_g1~~TRINITY_DN26549_c0_g1_i2.p1  ORF type:complete len:752 (+),score=163.24 TRINITY_DN26549_c0_g1_i2:88-2343(+)